MRILSCAPAIVLAVVALAGHGVLALLPDRVLSAEPIVPASPLAEIFRAKGDGHSAAVWLHFKKLKAQGSDGPKSFVRQPDARQGIPILVTSRFVLGAAIKKPDVAALPSIRAAADPLAWLKTRVEAQFVTGTEFMYVRVTDDDARDAAVLANAVADAFMEEVAQKDRQYQLRVREVMQQSHDRNMADVKKWRASLRELAKETGSVDPDMRAARGLHAVEAEFKAHERVREVDRRRHAAQRAIDMLKARFETEARPKAGEGAPEANKFDPKSGLSALTPQEQRHIWESAIQGIAPPPGTPPDLVRELIAHYEAELKFLEGDRAQAERELADAVKVGARLDELSEALRGRQSQIDRTEAVIRRFEQELETWDRELETPDVTIVERPPVPERVDPKK